MLELQGRVTIRPGGSVVYVAVFLDSEEVGGLELSLAQWDRLREHRRDARISADVGRSILIFAEGSDEATPTAKES